MKGKQLATHLVIAFLLFTTSLFAKSGTVDLGLELGTGMTDLRGNSILDRINDPKIGFSAGLSLQFNLTKRAAIRTNFSLERKGTQGTTDVLDPTSGIKIGERTFHTNFQYFTMPMMGRVTFGKRVNFFVNAGPYISYLIRQETILDEFNIEPEVVQEETSNYRSFDAGLAAGLGMGLTIGQRLILSGEVRSNMGWVNASKLPVVGDGTVKTNSTMLLVGVAVRLGKS